MKTAFAIPQLAVAAALSMVSSTALSDTIFGIYAGAAVWQADVSGDIGKSTTKANNLGLDDDNSNVFYVALEHPVPLLPNIKLQQTQLNIDGSDTLKSDFTVDDQTFSANTEVHTELNFDHTDVVLYYELLDNWVNFDFGVNLRNFDGDARVTSNNQSEQVDLNGWVPMLYGKAQFDLPFSGWSLAAEASAISYEGDRLVDTTAKVAYESDLVPLMGLGFELGYREMSLKLDELDDLEADVSIGGPYAAVTLHF